MKVLEEENSILHKKSLQYRLMTQELIDRQILLQEQLEYSSELEKEIIDLKAAHKFCPSEEEIQTRVKMELEKYLENAGRDSNNEYEVDDKKHAKISELRSSILQIAIAAKTIAQVCKIF